MLKLDETTPEELAKMMGVTVMEARFILAIHRGEIDGDVVNDDDPDQSAPGA